MSAHTNAKRNRNRGAGKAMVAAPAVAVLLMSASLMCAHAHASSPGNGTVSVTDEDLLKAVRQGTGDKARELAASKMANLTLAFRTPQRRLISATSGVSFVPLLAGPSYDLFEFGVLAGSGLRRWVQELGKRGIRWGHIWGFDSFKGMPDSDLQRHSPGDTYWTRGKMSSSETLSRATGKHVDVSDFAAMRDLILRLVGYSNTTLIPGFYNESLPSLQTTATGRRQLKRMQPAMIVDIDCDIYECTLEALEFMLRQRLMVPGTILYYDDWRAGNVGEQKAHNELTQKYGIVWARFATASRWNHYLYQLVSIAKPPPPARWDAGVHQASD